MNAEPMGTSAVTGAFGYTGKYIARRLLDRGEKVITLTGHPNRENPLGEEVPVYPFHFDEPDRLVELLRGVTTFYNTYWVRFPHRDVTYDKAVENTRSLVRAAKESGVRRFVHVSISQASSDSSLPYFRGKGVLEEYLKASGLSYAIIRPTVIFGREDILINNIAWCLRRFPVFAVPGSGDYRLQPIFVEDMARLVVEAGRSAEDLEMDAAGPDIFTFDDLVRLIGRVIGRKARLLHLPKGLTFALTRAISLFVSDVVLTRDEIAGLSANLLVSHDAPTGTTRLADWLAESRAAVGHRYASELKRHYVSAASASGD